MSALRHLDFAADVRPSKVRRVRCPACLSQYKFANPFGLHLLQQALHLNLERDRLKESYV
jgi:hypothetical protein